MILSTWSWVCPVSLLHILRIPFPKNTYGGLLLKVARIPETLTRACSVKKFLKVLKKNTEKHVCIYFNKIESWRPTTLLKRESSQMFSGEHCQQF